MQRPLLTFFPVTQAAVTVTAIPADLLKELKAWRGDKPAKSLIVPTSKRHTRYKTASLTQRHSTSRRSEAKGKKRIVILLGLKLGLRDQEIMHAEFRDIDVVESIYRVRSRSMSS